VATTVVQMVHFLRAALAVLPPMVVMEATGGIGALRDLQGKILLLELVALEARRVKPFLEIQTSPTLQQEQGWGQSYDRHYIHL
jgi:hypothetical protein